MFSWTSLLIFFSKERSSQTQRIQQKWFHRFYLPMDSLGLDVHGNFTWVITKNNWPFIKTTKIMTCWKFSRFYLQSSSGNYMVTRGEGNFFLHLDALQNSSSLSPTHSIHVDITYTSNHLKYKCNTTNIDTKSVERASIINQLLVLDLTSWLQ